MKLFLLALTLISACIYVQAQTQPKPSQNPNTDDAKAAAQVVESLFTAMKAKDAQAMSALFIKDGQLVAIDKSRPHDDGGLVTIDKLRTDDGSTTRIFSGDAFAKLISESKGADYLEQMKDPEVKIFGDMALVFGRYTFHVADKFSHCGTNSFHLVRTADGWKIANVASTLEFNCNR